MKVGAIQCNHCKDIVYSRANHDMRWCSCGKSAVDGGRQYLRVMGDFESFQITVDATEQELYNDWNKSEDNFGLIKAEDQ